MRLHPATGLAVVLIAVGAAGPAAAQSDDATTDSIQEGLDGLTIRLPPPVVFAPVDADE